MKWAEFKESIAKGTFFEHLDALPPTTQEFEERRRCLRWLRLIRTEAILRWASADASWVSLGVAKGDQEVWPVLRTLLCRYLLDLRTRVDTTALNEFWRWVTRLSGVADTVGGMWDAHASRLAETLKPTSERSLREQEEDVAILLGECATQTGKHPCLDWASEALAMLSKSRKSPSKSSVPTARIICVWEHGNDPAGLLRPGLILQFKLQCRKATSADWLSQRHVFSEDFLDALTGARKLHGPHRFYAIEHDWPELGQGILVGTSAGMAVAVAQHLATSSKTSAQHTMAPWVAISAAVNRDDGRAMRAGHLQQKMALLAEEGIRVVLTAKEEGWERESTLPLKAAASSSGPAALNPTTHNLVEVIGVPGGIDEFTDELKKKGALWPASIGALPRPGRWKHATISLAALLAIGAGSIGYHSYNHSLSTVPMMPAHVPPPVFQRAEWDAPTYISWAREIAGSMNGDVRKFDKLYRVQVPQQLENPVPDGL